MFQPSILRLWNLYCKAFSTAVKMDVCHTQKTNRKTAGRIKAVNVETQGWLSEGSQLRDVRGTGRHRSHAVPLSLLLCARGTVALPSAQRTNRHPTANTMRGL